MNDWSRRAWLQAALGSGVVCAAGCQPSHRLPPAGEWVGAGHAVGHRLRDQPPPTVAADAWRDVEVVIVGAGIAGLSAAWQLQRHGCRDVVVLELESVAGGTARSGQGAAGEFPWGAHYLPLPQPDQTALGELLRDMDVIQGLAPDGRWLVNEESLCRDPQERLFIEGRWQEDLDPLEEAADWERAQGTAWQQEVARWCHWRDDAGRRAFTLPSRHCSDAPVLQALDQISMAEWLDQRGWNSPHLRWLINYACRDDYGASIDQVSAWAGLFYFCARQEEMSGQSQPFLTWPDGNGRIVRHLAAGLGDRLYTGCPVWSIRPPSSSTFPSSQSADSTDPPRLEIAAGGLGDRPALGWRARHVIAAIPQFIAARVIPGYAEARGEWIRELTYGSWLVANVQVRDRPRSVGFPLAWDNVIYASPSLGYVVASHQRGLDHGPTVFTWYHAFDDADPRSARQRLLDLSWEEGAEMVLRDLELAHPDIRPLVERIDLMRWGHAMVRPRPGFRFAPARTALQQPFHGIHFAHTELSGLALFEEAFDHGLRAADEILMARRT
ncbi:MAG: FAD-dependent oxidoreductase [Pirellulales bacterium]